MCDVDKWKGRMHANQSRVRASTRATGRRQRVCTTLLRGVYYLHISAARAISNDRLRNVELRLGAGARDVMKNGAFDAPFRFSREAKHLGGNEIFPVRADPKYMSDDCGCIFLRRETSNSSLNRLSVASILAGTSVVHCLTEK